MNSYSTTGLPYARTLLSRKPHREQGISLDTCMLIIDDDRTSSLVLSFMLNLRGYGEIRAVRSAARAVAIAANFPDWFSSIWICRIPTRWRLLTSCAEACRRKRPG